MTRTSRRLPRFAGGWAPGQVAEGARLVLPLPDQGPAFEQAVNALCAAWNAQPFHTAYLTSTAPFLENVSILENLWIPLAWRRSESLAEVARKARRHLDLFGWTEPDLRHLLASRPGDLPAAVLGCAALLRALLMDPDWLLLEPGWFQRPLLGGDHNLSLLESALGRARWLLLWPGDQGPLPPGVPWHTIWLEVEA